MKKRTAVIGAFLSLLPLGQPLVIGTSALLTSSALMLTIPEKIQAESADFYINRGDEKYNNGENGDYYGAISDYTKAIEIDSRNAYAYGRRGIAKYDLNDLSGSLSDLTKSVEIKPDQFNLAFLADTKFKLGDYYGAISDYSKAITFDPSNFYAYKYRGMAKEKIGDLKGACSDWRKASSLGNEGAAKWVSNQC